MIAKEVSLYVVHYFCVFCDIDIEYCGDYCWLVVRDLAIWSCIIYSCGDGNDGHNVLSTTNFLNGKYISAS